MVYEVGFRIYILSTLFTLHGCERRFTTNQLKTLLDLRESYCASSENADDKNEQDPWFCVRKEDCKSKPDFFDLTKPIFDCDYLPFNKGASLCCYVGYIKGLESEKSIYGVPHVDFSQDARIIGTEFITHYLRETFIDNLPDPQLFLLFNGTRLCGLVPVPSRDEQTRFLPLVCTTRRGCEELINSTRVPQYAKDYYKEGKGNEFCSETLGEESVCCHPTAVSGNWRTELSYVYEFAALPDEQKYAVGFRSSFQCEQYAKYVCDGDKDLCPVEQKDKVAAGEFPHLALVGIKAPRIQFYHCTGAIVSRLFILSAVGCRQYDGYLASVVLIGEYNLWEYDETGSSELHASITDHVVQPRDFAPNTAEHQDPQTKIVLFRLWRPLTFNSFRRPACLNHLGDFPGSNRPRPKVGTLSGYGPISTYDRWSKMAKKYDDIQLQENNNDPCKKAFPNNPWDDALLYCYVRNTGTYPTDKPWGPCLFDLGGPISVKEPGQNPYCTWKVFGVSVSPVPDCEDSTSALFRRIDIALPWLEEVVFDNDFYLPSFDLSWPKCDTRNDQKFKEQDLVHLKKAY